MLTSLVKSTNIHYFSQKVVKCVNLKVKIFRPILYTTSHEYFSMFSGQFSHKLCIMFVHIVG